MLSLEFVDVLRWIDILIVLNGPDDDKRVQIYNRKIEEK